MSSFKLNHFYFITMNNNKTDVLLSDDEKLVVVDDSKSEEKHLAQLFLSLEKFNLQDFDSMNQNEIDKIQNILEKINKIFVDYDKVTSESAINFSRLDGIPYIQDLIMIMKNTPFPYIFNLASKIILNCIINHRTLMNNLNTDEFKELICNFLHYDSVTIKRSMISILCNITEFFDDMIEFLYEKHFLADLIHFATEITTNYSMMNNQMFIDANLLIGYIYEKSKFEYVDYCFEDFVNYIYSAFPFLEENLHKVISLSRLIKYASITESNRILSETTIFQNLFDLLRGPAPFKIVQYPSNICSALVALLYYSTIKNDKLFEGFSCDIFLNIIEHYQDAQEFLSPIIACVTNFVVCGPPDIANSFITPDILRFFSDIYQKTYNYPKVEILAFFWETGFTVNHTKFIDLYFPYLDTMFEIFEIDLDNITKMIIDKILPFIRNWILESKSMGEPLVEMEQALLNCSISDNDEISSTIQSLRDLIANNPS